MSFDLSPQFDLDALCERDEVLRVLVEADRLLSGPEKWCKRMQRNRQGAMCMAGAICIVMTGTIGGVVPPNIMKTLNQAMPAEWKERTTSGPAFFNNAPETKFSDIKTVFAKAITARARLVQGGAG